MSSSHLPDEVRRREAPADRGGGWLHAARFGHVGDAGALEDAGELVGPRRARVGDVGGDDPPLHEVRQRLLHRHHPARRAGLHHRVDLLDLRLADQVPDRVVGDEDLERRDAAAAVGRRHEVLGDDALQRRRELDADLPLLVGREHVDHAVDRLRSALRVQRREDEVAGLGGGQRGRDRLEVAHFADEDHVGVLAQRSAQRVRERRARPGRARAG